MSAASPNRRGRAVDGLPMIAVRDVFRDLGYEPIPSHTWSAGAAVAELWQHMTGTRPRLERRPKTNGEGSHALAVYPETWRERIEKIVRSTVAVKSTPKLVQPGIFDAQA